MVIFVDTSGWYAVLDADDGNHHRAGMECLSYSSRGIPSLHQLQQEVRL